MNSAMGSSWDDVRKELFTPEEIAQSDLWVAMVGERIRARQESEASQRQPKDSRQPPAVRA